MIDDWTPIGKSKSGDDWAPIGDDWNSGSSWEQANADGGSVMENTAARNKRPVQEEGILARAERLRQERLAKLKSQPVAAILNQLKVDPFSAVGGAYSDAKELFTGERAGGMVPEASIPSVVKGAVGVPMRISQGAYNTFMPDSPEANAANRMVDDANNWYWRQGFDESQYGEGIGSSALTAGAPIGTGAKFMQGGGRLAQLLKSMGTGSASGVLYSQVMTPKENIQSSQQYRDEALQDAITGGLTGFVMPAVQEGVGEAGRRLSPYFRKFKDFLREKAAYMDASRTGKKGLAPSEALIDDIGNMQRATTGMGRFKYRKAEEAAQGDLYDPNAIIDHIENNILPTLNAKTTKDKPLISALEEVAENLKASPRKPTGILDSNGNPIMGPPGPPNAPPTFENLTDLSRNIRAKRVEAGNTAGQVKQLTRTQEEKAYYDEIDGIVKNILESKNPKAAKLLDEARGFWSKGNDLFPAPADFTDTTRAGKIINALRTSDRADTAVSGLVRNKSGNVAKAIGDVTSKRGKAALQVELLQQAQKANQKMHPEKFVESLTDKNGELLPFAKEVFKGDDLKALQGFIRLKKFSDFMGNVSNLGGGVLAGSALGGQLGGSVGAGAGALTGSGAAIWAMRGKRLPNFTAPVWESLANNPATRSALAVMAKAPPTSPQFAKALAIIQQATKDDESE